jgi:type IV pilus assembly protein PilY1
MHGASTFEEADLVNVTDPAATAPNLDSTTQDVDGNSHVDQGWYIQLANGEKVLSEGTVFYKAFYVTTFTPNNEPCLPGGMGKLYALSYKTAGAVLDFDGNGPARSEEVGGGIPSKPVIAIRESMQKLFTSVGSSNPDTNSMSVAAGVKAIDPLGPPINFFYLWWKQVN